MQDLEDLVAAYRILAAHGVIDAYGHVSLRSPRNPQRYYLARSLAPELVVEADLIEYDLDSRPIDDGGRESVRERFIHGEIYKARPEVMAVVHNHSPSVVPFSVTGVPMRPLFHMAAFVGEGIPNFEIRDFQPGTDLLVKNSFLGKSLAGTLGSKPAALMRGHGSVTVGENLPRAVGRSVYLELSAQLQMQAMTLAGPGGKVTWLDEAEVAASSPVQNYARAWPMWRAKALGKLLACLALVFAGFAAAPDASAADPDAAKLAAFRAPDACKAGKTGTAYEFSEDWFSAHIPNWQRLLAPWQGKPMSYLEVGVYEGRSLLYALDNFLQHAKSSAIGVDIRISERYLRNLSRSERCAKVRNYQGPSQSVLRYLPRESFDVIYIDGAHTADAVLTDAVLAFDLLKDGGLIIFDDYAWQQSLPQELRPAVAIDAFVTAFRQRLTVVQRDYQLTVQKRSNPCRDAPRPWAAGDFMTSPVGNYCYHWASSKLSGLDGKPVSLSAEDERVVQAIARMPRFGETARAPDTRMQNDPAFQALNRKLKLFP